MKKPSSRESGNALLFFILIIAGLWVLWYFTGGPQRSSTNGGAFIDPNTGNTYNIGQ